MTLKNLFAAAAFLLSACAAPEPRVPPPDPILESDVVKDADAAAKVANTCYFVAVKHWGRFDARDARLIGDNWVFASGGGISMLTVTVSKRTGLLTDCTDIEQ